MGKLLFGKDETTTCIVDIAVTGRDHEPLCLAYKTTKTFVGAGVWMTDDGYVLRPRADSPGGHGKGIYYPLDAKLIADMQHDGDLPTPLPAYTIPATEWAAATSLYWVVALVVAFSLIVSRRKKRWRQAVEAERRERKVSFGPPARETEADRFIADQIEPHLRRGERVLHQAQGLDRHPEDGGLVVNPLYVAVTSQRVLVMFPKKGLRLRGMAPVESFLSIERSEIASLWTHDELFTFVTTSGDQHQVFLAGTRKTGSNGRAFLLDVPRILAGEVREPTFLATG
ncbi:MAG: hypothetical protein JST00_15140 [Deltaproteobacteria bacterium]|nr:hypothetical protein [Deltaproteobacteria bacterium]